MSEIKVGTVSHFFDKVSVVAIKLSGNLKIGDTVHIKGATTDFTQPISSMQTNKEDVKEAGPGDEIGIKVGEKCRSNDDVFKVVE